MLWYSGTPLLIQILLSLWLAWQLITIGRNPTPQPQLANLYFIRDHWLLETINTEPIIYQKHKVLIQTGVFFLLYLYGERNKIIVVFYDQLTPTMFRSLKVIERVHRN